MSEIIIFTTLILIVIAILLIARSNNKKDYHGNLIIVEDPEEGPFIFLELNQADAVEKYKSMKSVNMRVIVRHAEIDTPNMRNKH